MTKPIERDVQGQRCWWVGAGRALRSLLFCLLIMVTPVPASAEEPSRDIRLLVSLRGPALAKAALASEPELREALSSRRERVSAALRRDYPGAVIGPAFDELWNGLVVSVTPADLDRVTADLARHRDVTGVVRDAAFVPALHSSIDMLDLGNTWLALGGANQAGTGVRIAVIDSGIDIAHPMFDPQGLAMPAGYPKGMTAYTTPKVIVARRYVRADAPPLDGEDTPVPGILGSDHGTHIASVSAGRSVSAYVEGLTVDLSGVAPGALLMNYRVFYPSAGEDIEHAYTVELVQAIEDAVADGADIILAAWSSAAERHPITSPVAHALEAAMDSGVVVVTAAGNKGPTSGSASRIPGGIQRAITVGAVTKSSSVSADLADIVAGPVTVPPDLFDEPYGRALFGPEITLPVGPLPYTDVSTVSSGQGPYACGTLEADSLVGQIAMIRRGECDFSNKAYAAQEAGAEAVVIYNDSPQQEVTEMACAGDHCAVGDITVPVVMVSNGFGERAISWLSTYPTATLRLDPEPRIIQTTAGVLWDESGRGPAFASYLKPDVVSPGVSVAGALPGGLGEPRYGQATGTSVAAAHVAGAAALLLASHPIWDHDTTKSALMSSSTVSGLSIPSLSVVTSTEGGLGAGLIQVDDAADPLLLCDPPSATLDVARGESAQFVVSLRDPRTSGRTRIWSLAPSSADGVTFSTRDQITLAPGATREIDIDVVADADAAPGPREATLVLSCIDGQARVPLLATVTILPAAAILVIDNDFSFFASHRDYAPYVTSALDEAGISYAMYEADAYYDRPQTLPDLATLLDYGVILWLTGDNTYPNGTFTVSTPLTAADQQLLMNYLDAGGRLVALGPNIAQASDINDDIDAQYGRSPLYNAYLGAGWVQGSLPGESGEAPTGAAGATATWLSGVSVSFGDAPALSVDEIAPGGMADGSDVDLVQGLMSALGAAPDDEGYVALYKGDEPSIEDTVLDVPYRTVTMAFPADIEDNCPGAWDLAQLLERTYAWLTGELSASLNEPLYAAPGTPADLAVEARHSPGRTLKSYRWHLPGSNAESVTTSTPSVAPIYDEPGTYPVTVEATDDLGHRAVTTGAVTVTAGGASTLVVDSAQVEPGGLLTYDITCRNTATTAVDMTASVDLPASTLYDSHIGGDWTSDTWRWSGTLEAGSSFAAQVTVRVPSDVPTGSIIRAEAELTADSAPISLVATSRVLASMRLPLILQAR